MLRDFRYAPLSSVFILDISFMEIAVIKKNLLNYFRWRLPEILGPFGIICQQMN